MPRIVYLNNNFIPIDQANISIMDRGFLFADGVYDVTAVLNGKLVDNEAHLSRLQRSINEIKIAYQVDIKFLTEIQNQLIVENNLNEGLIYIQISRGVAERDFGYDKNLNPTLVMFTQEKNITKNPQRETGITAIITEDIRWKRRDIKSTALLAQVIAKNIAKEAGVTEALMAENGYITEGSSSNAYIVKNGVLITHNLSNEILHGITRKAILNLAKNYNIKIEERPFSVQETYEADECFISSATTFILPIVEVDGKKIGTGKPGELSKKLYQEYLNLAC